MSEALEARGFGMNENRTYYKAIHFNFVDILNGILFLSVLLICCAFRYTYSIGVFVIYPQYVYVPLTTSDYIFLSFLFGVNLIFIELCRLSGGQVK